MSKRSFVLASLVMLLPFSGFLSFNAYGQDGEGEESLESIERIEVYGQKPLKFYLNEFKQRQHEFYDTFNAIVDEPDMRIRCRNEEKGIGSRFRERVCQPLYVSLIKTEEKQNAIGTRGGFSALDALQSQTNSAEINARIKRRNEDLARKMNELMLKDGELWDRFKNLQAAKSAVDAKRAGR
jgi:hypothetical protein